MKKLRKIDATKGKMCIVIPLYNKKREIKRAVNSVINQTVTNYELIVVDDGSTDGGAGEVRSIKDSRIRLVQQENAGVSAARNRGIAEAKSDLIAFLDADDEWMPDFLETILRLYSTYPECGAWATAYAIIETNNRLRKPKFTGIPASPWEGVIPNYFLSARGTPPVWSSAVAVHKKIFSNVGYFQVGERIGEDLDMWCRIALKYPIAFSPKVCALYHRDAGNRACDREALNRTFCLIKTIESSLAKDDLPAGISREDLQEYRNKKLIESATAFIVAGMSDKARRQLGSISSKKFLRVDFLFWSMVSKLPYSWLNFARKVKNAVK